METAVDITAISQATAIDLQLRQTGNLTAEGFDGRPVQVAVYAARIILPTNLRGELNVITIPENYAILGRDVINLLRLLLDGPALTLEFLPPA